jgi:tryptophanyl-tRNA synthetase
MSDKKRVLSCIQPTGNLHLGNYFGAVKNWVDLQEQYECFYGIVDYHAMTMPYNTKKLRNQTWEIIIDLVSCGLKPNNIFIQSLIPEHAELGWIFNCFASVGRVSNMTQYKDKSQQNKGDGFISVGLFDYPVLQAADILIYKADFVPVGDDQDQHLELTREIAERVNNSIGSEYFILPQTLHTKTPRIKSPADPSRKMSKSAGDKHVIGVFEEEARIRKQIKSAVTDTGDTPAGEMSAGVTNLFELLKAANSPDYDQLISSYNSGELKYSELKECTADALVALTSIFIENKKNILDNKKELKYQIKQSSAEIRKVAQQTLTEVKELVGLMNVKF